MRLRHLPLAGVLLVTTTLGARADDIAERVDRLLKQMTLEEKIGQLNMPSIGKNLSMDAVARGEVGAVLNFFSPESTMPVREAVARSRLKIPVLFGLDVLHGYRTMFPMPLAEAASFDPTLTERTAYWAAIEAKAGGVDLTFAPMADVYRDARWGRGIEGGGEDPLLSAAMTRARVEGFKRGGLGATVKHFAAYGAVEAGRDYASVDMSPGMLRDRYLPPYRAAVEAGVDAVMTSYVTVNGVPTTGSRFLMTDVLRGEWGFDGFVVSDMNAIAEMGTLGVVETGQEAAALAFEAGVDQDMDADHYRAHLADLVRTGKVAMESVDRSAGLVLAAKMRLGLFDAPPFDPAAGAAVIGSPDIRAVARAAARDTFVLLKNTDATLPLAPSVKSIAVIGGLADDRRNPLGQHAASARESETVTVIEGLRARAGSSVSVTHAAGCDAYCRSDDGFAAAIEAARGADVTVLVLGEPRDHAGEGGSRTSLALPGRQRELIAALSKLGKPIVLVLMNGRALALEDIHDQVSSILVTWYPGTEGGNAIADVLFGDAAPSARLPVTFPRTTGQVPLTYNEMPTGRPANDEDRYTSRFVDVASGPLYPFGWGLTYTTFRYQDVEIVNDKLGPEDWLLRVSVDVTNTGEREGRTVAQLYIRDLVASRTRPVRELKAFQPVTLAPGETKRIELAVSAADLGFHLDDGTYMVEPGRFRAFVGDNALATLSATFDVEEGMKLAPKSQSGAHSSGQTAASGAKP